MTIRPAVVGEPRLALAAQIRVDRAGCSHELSVAAERLPRGPAARLPAEVSPRLTGCYRTRLAGIGPRPPSTGSPV